jgi:hypothetical protein
MPFCGQFRTDDRALVVRLTHHIRLNLLHPTRTQHSRARTRCKNHGMRGSLRGHPLASREPSQSLHRASVLDRFGGWVTPVHRQFRQHPRNPISTARVGGWQTLVRQVRRSDKECRRVTLARRQKSKRINGSDHLGAENQVEQRKQCRRTDCALPTGILRSCGVTAQCPLGLLRH